MARSIQSNQLRNRTSRLKLVPRGKPYKVLISPGVHLAYRANQDRATSSWSVQTADWLKRIALADDHQDSDGKDILNYYEAQQAALKLARGTGDTGGRPVTVMEALDAWQTDLESRGGAVSNATTVRFNLEGTALGGKTVLALSDRDLSDWRDGLLGKVKLSSANRIGKSLKAALALAARRDGRITNAHAWVVGLKPKKVRGERTAPRENYYLADHTINALVAECYREDPEFGALIHTLAVTGTRESQALRIYPADIIDENPASPSLLVWCSEKGKDRTAEQRSVAITPSLCRVLKERALARGRDVPLLAKVWNIAVKFREVLKRLGLDETLTPYVLRHSSIIREIRGNKPARLIAYDHDTSLTELEKTYARFLEGAKADFSRIGLLADDVAPANNVVPVSQARTRMFETAA